MYIMRKHIVRKARGDDIPFDVHLQEVVPENQSREIVNVME